MWMMNKVIQSYSTMRAHIKHRSTKRVEAIKHTVAKQREKECGGQSADMNGTEATK